MLPSDIWSICSMPRYFQCRNIARLYYNCNSTMEKWDKYWIATWWKWKFIVCITLLDDWNYLLTYWRCSIWMAWSKKNCIDSNSPCHMWLADYRFCSKQTYALYWQDNFWWYVILCSSLYDMWESNDFWTNIQSLKSQIS